MTMPRADRRRHPTMRMAAFGLFLAVSAGGAQAQKAADLSGLWQTETAGSTVRIARCGGG